MSSKRIAVLVSGGGTNLQAPIDAQRAGKLQGGEIVAVLSSKSGAYALERAARVGIPGYVVARRDFPSNQAMTLALVERLQALDIDLVVLAGFLHILTAEMVAAYPNAILYVHPALLPPLRESVGVGDERFPFPLAAEPDRNGLFAFANYNIGTAATLLSIVTTKESMRKGG